MQLSILDFQKEHYNHLGKKLDQDGVLGPQTRWAMDVASLSHERRLVWAAARPHIGLTEEPFGSNDEPTGTIDGWLKRAHAPEGEPWCASAASAWLSVATPVAIAGAIRLGKHFPAVDRPWAFDLFWYPTDNKGHGHVGLVIGVGSTEVMTLEGNCRNKVMVARRPIQGLNFSRTFDETIGTCPKVILDKNVPLIIGGGMR
jgi:hypothetical protein